PQRWAARHLLRPDPSRRRHHVPLPPVALGGAAGSERVDPVPVHRDGVDEPGLGAGEAPDLHRDPVLGARSMAYNLYFEDVEVGHEIPTFQRQTDFMHWNRYAAVNDEFVYLHMDDEVGKAAGQGAAFGM